MCECHDSHVNADLRQIWRMSKIVDVHWWNMTLTNMWLSALTGLILKKWSYIKVYARVIKNEESYFIVSESQQSPSQAIYSACTHTNTYTL